MTVILPWAPSVNTYYRHVGARVLIAARGRAYRREVGLRCAIAGMRPLAGEVHVVVMLHPPDRRRRDVDNIAKALLDALQGWAYADDRQVGWLEIRRGATVAGGSVEVEVTPWR